jgi:hypothetical protein
MLRNSHRVFTWAYKERGKTPSDTFASEEFMDELLRVMEAKLNETAVVEVLCVTIKIICRLGKKKRRKCVHLPVK